MNKRIGDICWTWKASKGSRYATLMLEGRLLIVRVSGWMWAIDPVTGEEPWPNPLKGLGSGVACMVSTRNPGGGGSTSQSAVAVDAAAAVAGAA